MREEIRSTLPYSPLLVLSPDFHPHYYTNSLELFFLFLSFTLARIFNSSFSRLRFFFGLFFFAFGGICQTNHVLFLVAVGRHLTLAAFLLFLCWCSLLFPRNLLLISFFFIPCFFVLHPKKTKGNQNKTQRVSQEHKQKNIIITTRGTA